MTPVLDYGELGSNLDCQNFSLLNIRQMIPVPDGLVALDDPKLYDPRVPPFGSVTDDSVAATAEIGQSKLSLNGQVPVPWLGTGADQAAQGNLVERVARKGVASGYAALDANGRLSSANVTTGGAAGTVNSVALSTPEGVLVSGSPITTSGTLAVTFKPTLNNTWFGVNGGKPTSFIEQVPLEFVPPLDATKFATGTFTTERLPEAIGMGLSHAKGVVPDTGKVGGPGDYLGRDMKWHHFDSDKSYQPTLTAPGIALVSWGKEAATIRINSHLKAATLFYRVVIPDDFGTPLFTRVTGTNIAITVPERSSVQAYSARSGFNNSDISEYTVITPETPPEAFEITLP